ncbi:MAG: radical SAM protein [Dehalococcoidales bacterium]|nr:radical SAM protein [Dehalococcoidales bacterium]
MTGPATKSERPLFQEILERCSALHIPIQAVIELTHRCNLRCIHCYSDVLDKEELTLDDWKLVIDKLKAAGTMFLHFTGGEPLVREDFIDIATYGRRQGFFIGLMSNFTLITPDLVRGLAALNPYSLSTSLYGATAATHDSVTKIAGSFNNTLQGIELLVAGGLTPDVKTVIMNQNIEEIKEIHNLISGLGARAVVDVAITATRSGKEHPLRYAPIREDLLGCGWIPEIAGHSRAPRVCNAGKCICGISPSGGVFPCTMIPIKLGDICTGDFESFWHWDVIDELKYLRDMKPKDLKQCLDCDLIEYCLRCTGTAYLESGSLSGKSSSACRAAGMRRQIHEASIGG